MPADSTFDVVCNVDLQEVKNAIQHAMKEIGTRFDLKGSGTTIELVDDGAAIEIASSDEIKLEERPRRARGQARQARHRAQGPVPR